MALIGKIRKNFWFVLILLGLALAAFILMDMTSAGNAGGPSSVNLGSVGGKKIDFRAFQQTEQAYYGNSNVDPFTKKKNIWDFYVEKALLEDEAADIGLSVSRDELMDLQFGPTPSPIITQNWRNPQTGQVDQASLQQFKTAIENNDPLNPQFRSYWAEQEKQIIKQGVQSKLNTLINKAVYTPSWMATESFKLDNTKLDFSYVKIPFDVIDGAGIEVSDSEISSYINSKKEEFTAENERRTMEYAVFNVVANAADSANIRSQLTDMIPDLSNSENDSLFVVSKNGSYTHLYGKPAQMPEAIRNSITGLNAGEIGGPFANQGYYMLVKVLDKKNVADSVEARHILKSAVRDDASAVAAARASIDSIRRKYLSGVSFDTLAARHSDDPTNNKSGGDLGQFDQTRMVPEFATASFANGRKGGLYTVQTDFGIHLLEVTDQVFNDDDPEYRIASVSLPIIPSQDTQDEKYDVVTEVVSNAKNLEDLKKALEAHPDVVLQESTELSENDFSLGTLGATEATRKLIQWSFDPSTEIGDISPEIYRFTDQVNYFDSKYVLAGLKSILPKGLPSAASMRSQLEVAVLNQKKAQKFVQSLNPSSLESLASEQGQEVLTANAVSAKSASTPGLVNEDKVIAAAFETEVQSLSKPIIGETGVFVVKTLNRQEAGEANNISFIKSSLANSTRSQINFSIIQNMKKRADIKDDRKDFF